MDENGIKLWLHKIWSKRTGSLLKKPALLVCDRFRSHVTEVTKSTVTELNTLLAVISGGSTSQLQQLEVSVNKLFKELMCEKRTKWFETTHHDLTPTGQVATKGRSLWMGEEFIEVCEA
jgi:hypothetical protein